jgi:hypothetical protein
VVASWWQVLAAAASTCDLDQVLSALEDFGWAPGTSVRRSHPALDHIRLDPNMEPCPMRLSKTGVLHADGDTRFACYCTQNMSIAHL